MSLPTLREYSGGGVLLSPTTLLDTVLVCCDTFDLLQQVHEMFLDGYEVIIHHGKIVAASKVEPCAAAPSKEGRQG